VHTHTFAGGWFDRAGHIRRDDLWLQAQKRREDARYLVMSRLRALMSVDGGIEVSWRSGDEVRPFLEADCMVVLLGLHEGVPHFAIDISRSEDPRAFPEFGRYLDVRSAASQAAGEQAAALSQARSLLDWHARHGYCAVCGRPTAPHEAGYMRQCLSEDCRAQHFPRTDPVTIMLIFDEDDNVLLGRQPRFDDGVYSALAGFVEPGENIEEAVIREVMEEVGITIDRVSYHSSQPWPFPSSLMIGCFAYARDKEIHLDQEELQDARWFTRLQAAAMVENWDDKGATRMPPPLSIAHQLARGWLRGD